MDFQLYRRPLSQSTMKEEYENALYRKAKHPSKYDRYRRMVENSHTYDTEEEACRAALGFVKPNSTYCPAIILAFIERGVGEEFHLTGPWIVTDDNRILQAADFLNTYDIYNPFPVSSMRRYFERL